MNNPTDKLVEVVALAIARTVADGDDIDIQEALENGFDWITTEQTDRMIQAAATAALSAARPLIERETLERAAKVADAHNFGPARDERDSARNATGQNIAQAIRGLQP